MSVQIEEENGGTLLAVCASGNYFSDIERRAMAGPNEWQKGMATFCRPFTTAPRRYFARAYADGVRTWTAGNSGKQHE